MEKSTKKKVIIITALLVIGGTVGYFLWKRNKDKKAADEAALLSLDPGSPSGESTSGSGSGTQTSTMNVDEAPPTLPADVLASSFAALKSALGTRAKNYGTYLIFETTQKSLGLGTGTAKVIVKLTNGGRWAIFLRELKLANRINEGAYYNGGKKIVVYSGKNKGLVVEGQNALNNLARSVK